MGLIRFLIFAICILYIIKMLGKIFLPFLFKSAVNKMNDNVNGQGNRTTNQKPTGTISVDYIPPSDKKQHRAKGDDDFIEYEEVK
jgi:hypothetical protein